MRENHDEQDFYRLYQTVYAYTMSGTDRLRGLYDAVMSAVEEGIPGDIVECGTAKGGSAALMGLVLKVLHSEKILWVCDTFEGIPPPTVEDPPGAAAFTGKFKGSIEEVSELFTSLGIMDQAQLVKGMFQDTLSTLKINKIAVLHLDGDWYESTKAGLENLYDRVPPGGFIQIDDYGHWAGCRKAVDEFFQDRGQPALTWLDYTGVQFRKEIE